MGKRIQNSKFKIHNPEICSCRAVTLWQTHEGQCLHNDDVIGIPPASKAEWRDVIPAWKYGDAPKRTQGRVRWVLSGQGKKKAARSVLRAARG